MLPGPELLVYSYYVSGLRCRIAVLLRLGLCLSSFFGQWGVKVSWDGSEDGAGVGQVFGGDSGELLRRWFRATAHQGSESGVRSAAVGSLPVLGSLLINLGQDTMNSW